jgi:hypothetical protein
VRLTLGDPQRDRDGDGLADVWEAGYGADPDQADTDGDTLPDGLEVTLGLNPRLSNDDSDGVASIVEVGWDGNPATYTPATTDLSLTLADSDADGVNDCTEIAAGSNPRSAASHSVVTITLIDTDAWGNPRVRWNVYANQPQATVVFHLQYAPAPAGPW